MGTLIPARGIFVRTEHVAGLRCCSCMQPALAYIAARLNIQLCCMQESLRQHDGGGEVYGSFAAAPSPLGAWPPGAAGPADAGLTGEEYARAMKLRAAPELAAVFDALLAQHALQQQVPGPPEMASAHKGRVVSAQACVCWFGKLQRVLTLQWISPHSTTSYYALAVAGTVDVSAGSFMHTMSTANLSSYTLPSLQAANDRPQAAAPSTGLGCDPAGLPPQPAAQDAAATPAAMATLLGALPAGASQPPAAAVDPPCMDVVSPARARQAAPMAGGAAQRDPEAGTGGPDGSGAQAEAAAVAVAGARAPALVQAAAAALAGPGQEDVGPSGHAEAGSDGSSASAGAHAVTTAAPDMAAAAAVADPAPGQGGSGSQAAAACGSEAAGSVEPQDLWLARRQDEQAADMAGSSGAHPQHAGAGVLGEAAALGVHEAQVSAYHSTMRLQARGPSCSSTNPFMYLDA